MKNLIFYKTTADFDNTGEVLIYSSLLYFLRRYGNVVIDDGPHNSPLFLERIGIREEERLSRLSRLSFISFMCKSSFLSLFSKRRIWFVTGVGEHDVRGVKSIIKNLLAFCFLGILRFCGVHVLRIGMSMRFNGRWEMFSEKLLSSIVNFYYVRDSISLTNCHQAGITKCRLAPDLSWGRKFDNLGGAENKKTNIVFSFRDFCESIADNGAYKQKLTEKILLIIDRYTEDSQCGQILLTYQCNADYDYMRDIYSLCQHKKVKLADELITLENAHKYYGQASTIFSNRLHVILLGYKFGAPTICVSDIDKHRKIKGILEDNHLKEALLDINLHPSEFIQRLSIINERKDEIESKYKDAEKNNYQKLTTIFESLFDGNKSTKIKS